jgi:hypothetical protein
MATTNVSSVFPSEIECLPTNPVDELSTLRPLKNEWSRECIETYHQYMPKDDPVEDWESRHALYAL